MVNIHYENNLRELAKTLSTNLREDITLLKDEMISAIKHATFAPESPDSNERRFTATLPLPSNIHITQSVQFANNTYSVTFDIKCGVRNFTTTLYIGTKLDNDLIAQEMRNCIMNAVKECLHRDRGQIHELGESDKIVNIQSL